jgi:hypothetical protein
MRNCFNCKEVLVGRIDKKFCDGYCKSAYHYKENQKHQNIFFKRVESQIKLNRRLLREFNKSGKSSVRSNSLLDKGFSPDFFTHYWKNKSGEVYLFVYEFGFLRVKQNGREKFILVMWQDYMQKNRLLLLQVISLLILPF